MSLSFIVLLVLPYIMKSSIIRSGSFRPCHKLFFWVFLVICILLSWIGGIPVLEPYVTVGRILTVLFFLIILIGFPLGIFIDKIIYDIYNLNLNKKK
jgi:ubiquinol-cytochrome c reductase cytochrome b/c1 subunit